jgi:uncharacterized membrane protein
MKKYFYHGLLIFTKIATIAGLLTLIPWNGASYENVFGYKSLCTYAPAATLFCFLIAGLSCFIRANFFNIKEERKRIYFERLIPLILVAILAISAGVWFSNVKAFYMDTQSAATASQ